MRRQSRTTLRTLAISAALIPVFAWASNPDEKGGTGATRSDSGWIKSLDTSWNSPFWSGSQGGLVPPSGTGPGNPPGMGGSGTADTGYLKGDTLWSSPYEGPATPGSGLPNQPGSGWPATGSGGGSGTGGSGLDGREIPRDSTRKPRTGPSPMTPSDTIGANEWMERG